MAKRVRFFLKRDGLPTTRPHWLIVARNMLEPDEVKFSVSNAPAAAPAEDVLHLAFNRWPVERCFEDAKTELGLDHFEGRTYTALNRHLAITAVTFLFLSKVRLECGGKKSGPDRMPGADRRRRAGRLGGPVPDVPARPPRPGGRLARPEPAGRRLPPPCHARAA